MQNSTFADTAKHYLPVALQPHATAILAVPLSVTAYAVVATSAFFFIWPHVLFSHPSYQAPTRLKPTSQLKREVRESLYTALILPLVIYAYQVGLDTLFVARGFAPADTTSDVSRDFAILFVVFEFGGYVLHRLLHANETVYTLVHDPAHQFTGKSTIIFIIFREC